TLSATSLTGSNGDQLAAPLSITFKTHDATWQAPELIDHLTANQFGPVTAINAKGVRFVAWLQSNDSGTGNDIWAIRHVPGMASTDAVRVASFPENYISQLNVFVDEDGDAFVTWVVDRKPIPITPWHLWAVRFSAGGGPGTGWETPQIIDGYSARSATQLRLKFDHNANAIALWQEYDCCGVHSLQSILVSRYNRYGGWSKPVHLDDSDPFLLEGVTDLQIDDAGNAYATWLDLEDIHYPAPQLLVSRYTASNFGPNIIGSWSAPRTITTESTSFSTGFPALAVNHHGDAFVMWGDDTGLKYARTDELGRWGTPILVDVSMKISPSQLVLLDDGEAFAAFTVGVRQYLPATRAWTWAHPLLTDQDATGDPYIVADASGNAMVAWTQTVNGSNRIYAKRYRANHGWFHSEFIDAGNASGAELQDLFQEPDGSVTATWMQYNADGTVDVQAARFE
ncbi:MAG: hypothetical protein ABUL58_08160, partial [Steroidobacter sp.]